MKSHQARSLPFYVVLVYILIQLSWWGLELIQSFKSNGLAPDVLQKKIWMVIGEGCVFVVLLLVGFRYILISIKKQLNSAYIENTFLLSVTHELKTPIASVRLLLDTLHKRKPNPEIADQLIQDARTELTRLQNQIENILLTARTTKADRYKEDHSIQLSELIHLQQIKFNQWYPTRTIQFESNVTRSVNMDQELLTAILFNLVDNAVKYSSSEGNIFIEFSSNENHLHLLVQDQGGNFATLPNPEVTPTGLGMNLVENIVKWYNGTCQFNFNHDHGTAVTITFPNVIQ
jgi:K+-sensing histidine kinase KdpD